MSTQEAMKVVQAATEEARTKILGIRDEVSVMGGNDIEIPQFRDLLERLDRGEINPQKAIEEAEGIRDSKDTNRY